MSAWNEKRAVCQRPLPAPMKANDNKNPMGRVPQILMLQVICEDRRMNLWGVEPEGVFDNFLIRVEKIRKYNDAFINGYYTRREGYFVFGGLYHYPEQMDRVHLFDILIRSL
ncbi:hypothetical protein CEXT_784371 [Caerostris extrusa]|uniref:Uncharacterized protein n=1 Tax=Caerostris extrusa TaxID=172846 RepID=A0AAV4R3R0_CAEEX|nr:hypothetical protein CEXT_784371 [Caerostris extrusa]